MLRKASVRRLYHLMWLVTSGVLACSGEVAAPTSLPLGPNPPVPPIPPVPKVPILVIDDFDRASLGAAWSIQPNTGAVVSLGNGDLGTGSGNLLIASYIGAVFPGDQFSEAEFSAAYDNSALKGVQVFVRRQDGPGVTPWRYGFYYNGPTQKWTIKYDGGPTAGTDFMREIAGAPPAPGDVIRIEARGTLLRGLLNGVEVARVTDARLTSGLAGVAINPWRAAPRTVARWTGGSL